MKSLLCGLFLTLSACAPKHVPLFSDRSVHQLHTVSGTWRRTGDHEVLMLTDSQRDVPHGVKEICKAAVCTSEPAGIVTQIHIQEKPSK